MSRRLSRMRYRRNKLKRRRRARRTGGVFVPTALLALAAGILANRWWTRNGTP